MNAEKKPTVMIVGAGLGGLLLGTLLQKAGISFNIFERSPTVKELGIPSAFLLILSSAHAVVFVPPVVSHSLMDPTLGECLFVLSLIINI